MPRSWEGEPASLYVCARSVAPGSFLLAGSLLVLQDEYLFEYVDDAFLDYKPRDLRSLWE
jgi:hypothetical protein